ncbi:hypothetical protein HY480_00910, partial [Candidatus Uhrbacteria bacterium]|nr:hypothetical protein [Candidatus Uhrbacteria bacterium]
MFTTASASRGLRASWFVFVVPMAIGALLLLGIASAQAQQGRPDFQVIKATFDGRNLHVEYVNATGVGYPRVRYEVGFQWYDSTGKPVGERHWLPVPEVERGGVAILDTKYRIDLTYRRSGSNYNRRLLDFILQRPNTAEELRVTVDDGDRVSETNESNNVASLRIPLPDLWITGAKFLSPNQLELSYRNLNPSPIPLPFRIGFTWAMESGTHLTPTRWINVVEPRDGATETVVLSRTDASYITTQNRQAGDRLDWYFERRPGNATRLQVTMDDAGTVREQNELNNMVSVRPFLPDLVVRDAKLANGQLTFTYGNDGDGYIRDIASRVAFQWVNAAGKPIGDPRWSGFAQMNPKQAFTMNADRFDVQYVVPGTNRTTTQRLSTYLGTRPEGATQFRVTIDDEQKLLEADEGNNVVTIAVVPSVAEPDPIVKPFPDLAITSFALGEEATGDILRIRFKNLGGSTALTRSGDSLIPFWLVWTHANGQSVAGASSYWFDLRREPLLAGMEGATTVTLANGAILVPHGAGRGAGRTITQFFADPPTGATHLQAIIDGPNRIEESNETNNTAIIERPAPDLTIEKVEATTDALTIRYRNRGAINAVDRSGRGVTTFWLTWTDADGKAIADAKRYGVDTRSNALLQPGEERTLTLQEALGAIIVPHGSDLKSGLTLAQFFAEAPEHATHLQVVIDGPNTYAEANEQNNAALLKFLKPVQPKPEAPIVVPNEVPKPEEPPPPPPRQPDLTITDATLDTAALRFWMRNLGEGPATPVVSIWYEWVDEKGERVGELRWINVGGMSPKSKQQGNQ